MTACNKLFNEINLPEIIKIFRFIFLISVSVLIIFYKFNQIPKNLAFDEVEFAKLALSLENKPYTPYSPQATGHTTLYFYIILFSFKIFGVNNFSLRLPAALFGVANILIFYLILNKVFDNNKKTAFLIFRFINLPLILSFILLTSHWYLNFTRFAFEATFLLFLELGSIYFLILSWQRKKNQNLFILITGLLTGLAFNSYTPGRIFFILPLFFLILQNLKTFQFYKLIYFLIPFIITITPLTNYFLKHQDLRVNQLFFWKNHEINLEQKIRGTLQNISSLTLMFFTKGDINGRHNYPGKPALNPILAVLLIIGIMMSLKKFNKLYNRFFFLYFFLSLAPSIPIYPWENPNMLRTYTTLPAVIFFIANAFIAINNLITKIIKTKLYKQIVFNALVLLLIFSCLYELRTYFKYQAKVFQDSFEIKQPLEEVIKSNHEKN